MTKETIIYIWREWGGMEGGKEGKRERGEIGWKKKEWNFRIAACKRKRDRMKSKVCIRFTFLCRYDDCWRFGNGQWLVVPAVSTIELFGFSL